MIVPKTSKIQARFTDPLRRSTEHDSIVALLLEQAQQHNERSFLICEDEGREISFREIEEQSARVANLLTKLNVQKGERVALALGSEPEDVFIWFGVMRTGAVCVPLNTGLGTESLKYQLQDSGASVLFAGATFIETMSETLADSPGMRATVVVGQRGSLELSDDAVEEGQMHAESVLANMSTTYHEPEMSWWDEAMILYTGVATPTPKGAIIQHRQLLTSARRTATWLKLSSGDRVFSVLPFFHVNGLVPGLLAPMIVGAQVISASKFRASHVWPAVEKYKVTVMNCVPAMLGILTSQERQDRPMRKYLRNVDVWPNAKESPGALRIPEDTHARETGLARGHDIRSVRLVLSGAAPLTRQVCVDFEATFLIPVIEGYSQSETSGFCTLNPIDGTRKIGSVGLPLGTKVCVVSDDNPAKPLDDWTPTCLERMSPSVFPALDANHDGEICVWGDVVMKEYFRAPEANPTAFAGGWFHTGDFGRTDSDAYVYVYGPKSDVIQMDTGTFSPREIDEVVTKIRDVEQVVSIAESIKGSPRVKTFVIFRRGTFPDGPNEGRLPANDEQRVDKESEIREVLRDNLPEGKRPTTLLFLKDLPQDRTGKTRRWALRDIQDTDQI